MKTGFWKKQWVRILSFFLILLLLLAGMSSVTMRAAADQSSRPYLKRDAVEMEVRKEAADSLDVLVLGDSEAYRSFSPLQLWNERGITSFTIGLSGAKMTELLHLLDVAAETQKPRVVLLETDALYRIQGSAAGMQEIFLERWSSWFPVFQYHNLWKQVFDGAQPVTAGQWKGFHMAAGVKAADAGSYMAESREKRPVSSCNRLLLGKIKDKCATMGADLVLYSAPSTVNYNSSRHNAIAELAQQMGIAYLDLNQEAEAIGINWQTDTSDAGDHLNVSGAQRVTQRLGGFLQQYSIADKRKNAAYASWNSLGAQYRDKADRVIQKIRNKADAGSSPDKTDGSVSKPDKADRSGEKSSENIRERGRR